VKHIKQLYQAKQIIQAVHDNIYNSNEVSDIKYHDSESFRPIDEIASLLQAIHPQERVWASPYDVESCVSDYLSHMLPIMNDVRLQDLACGIYSVISASGGLRNGVGNEPLVITKTLDTKPINNSSCVFNGATLFGGI
jgi:hypothetical protein